MTASLRVAIRQCIAALYYTGQQYISIDSIQEARVLGTYSGGLESVIINRVFPVPA